jgi:Myo-inositol-1-phosphate synthase
LIPYGIDSRNVHIGPSDYVPWLKDKKLAFIRIEGRLFGDVPMNIELTLEVEDSCTIYEINAFLHKVKFFFSYHISCFFY